MKHTMLSLLCIIVYGQAQEQCRILRGETIKIYVMIKLVEGLFGVGQENFSTSESVHE